MTRVFASPSTSFAASEAVDDAREDCHNALRTGVSSVFARSQWRGAATTHVDDGHANGADGVQDGHDTAADGAEDGFNL